MDYMVNSDELSHYGIMGQKWGVRRFQNKDGSLTQEGYQHYGLNPDGSRHNRRQYSESTKRASSSGTIAGAAVGAVFGPVGAMVGSISGATIGTIAGAINTSVKRKKIQRLLEENGKVYVKDL